MPNIIYCDKCPHKKFPNSSGWCPVIGCPCIIHTTRYEIIEYQNLSVEIEGLSFVSTGLEEDSCLRCGHLCCHDPVIGCLASGCTCKIKVTNICPEELSVFIKSSLDTCPECLHPDHSESGKCIFIECKCIVAYPKPSRPSKDKYWIDILCGIAARGTCPRRQSSALIVDEDNHLLSSGYNGSPKNIDHCIESPCEGVDDKSGDSSRCIAVHAEQNAIIQAGDRLRFATKMYTLTYPCFVCAKLICQTYIKEIVYVLDYPDDRSKSLLKKADIIITKQEIK